MSTTERMPDGDELDELLSSSFEAVTVRAAERRSRHRHRRMAVWSSIGAGVVLATAVAAAGPLRPIVMPGGGTAQLAVHCYDAAGAQSSSWFADPGSRTDAARVDPVAECSAMVEHDQVLDQIDGIAAQQRALGRQCVTFGTSDGGRWYLTGLDAKDGSYGAVGGPAPWQLPGEAVRSGAQPSPAVTLAPGSVPASGCTELPVVTWTLSAPSMAACTKDDVTIDVFTLTASERASAVCAARGLVEVGRR